jgi:chromate transporter
MPEGLSLRQFTLHFLRLGAVGFGGPVALAGYMRKDLVEDRKWISPDEYNEGLALAQLAPGPLAAQLAIYLGWVRASVLGATPMGAAFVVPSFLMVLALTAAYLQLGGLPVDAGNIQWLWLSGKASPGYGQLPCSPFG